MTTEITQEQKQEANALIAEQIAIAQAALAKAEELAQAAQVQFSFTFDDTTGRYYTGTYRNGGTYGYYDGWQGSSC